MGSRAEARTVISPLMTPATINPAITLRATSIDELVGFTRLEQDADAARYILPTSLQQHQQQFARDDIVYLTIELAGETCGFLILALEVDGNSVEFRRIVVANRGAGIGQRAIPAMEAWCRDQLGRRRIWLDVFDDNHRGQHVYEKLGYRRFKKAPHDHRTLYFYHKELP